MRVSTMTGVAGMASVLLLATPGLAQTSGSEPMQTAEPVSAAEAAPARPVQERPFQGLYVGGVIGFDAQPNDPGESIRFNRNGLATVTTAAGADAFSPGFCNGAANGTIPDSGCRNDRDELSYAGRIGFDLQNGPFVLGALAEFGDTRITDSVSGFSTTPASYTLTRSIDWELGLRGRAGLAARNTLFYGTGGAGYARIRNDFSTSNTANAFAVTGTRNKWGIQYGGGIEQKIGRNFSIGLEYLYHDYNTPESRVLVTQGTAPVTNPFVLNGGTTTFSRSDNKFNWHSVRATASFRF